MGEVLQKRLETIATLIVRKVRERDGTRLNAAQLLRILNEDAAAHPGDWFWATERPAIMLAGETHRGATP